MTTPAVPIVLPRLTFRLPGDWWAVDLHDRSAAAAAAARLVRHRLGTHDERAALRARIHHDLMAAIDEAIRGQGQSMFIAIQIVEAVPLPISVTVYLPEIEMTPAIGTDPARVLDILQRGLAGVENDEIGDLGELVRMRAAGADALRSSRVRQIEIGSDGDRGELEVLLVDYWLPVPESKRVALVSFSSSFAALNEPLTAFFDAIMRVALWADDVASDPLG